jgi:poly-beta-1,6-N-acetyl-D-glucosamine biosynthesis protein PgaD
VRVRDIVGTLAAWALLSYMLRDVLALIADYFSYPFFELTRTEPHTWQKLWERMQSFVILSLAAMLWLATWAVIRRRQLRYFERVTSPPSPLPAADHAASFGLEPGAVDRWREAKVTTVRFDSANPSSSPRRRSDRCRSDLSRTCRRTPGSSRSAARI